MVSGPILQLFGLAYLMSGPRCHFTTPCLSTHLGLVCLGTSGLPRTRFGNRNRWSPDRLSDSLVEGTVKFGGGSVMVWGCMLWDGPGYACQIDARMDGDLFIQILDDELQGTLTHYGKTPQDIIFQQDNDPKHT